MTGLRFICIVGALALLGDSGTSHTLHFGRTCPDVHAYPNLSINKVLGEWFVVYKTDTGNTCLLWNITMSPINDEVLYVTEKRQLSFLDLVGVDHTHETTATISMPNAEIPSRLRAHWPGSVSGAGDFIIFDTDYTNYMAIFECNRAAIVHRRSVTILSRTSSIDDMLIKRVRRLLDTADVHHGSLDKISHDLCKKEGKHNWSHGEPDHKGGSLRRIGEGVLQYDISEIEIIGDGVSENNVGSFRGSIKHKKMPDM